MFNKEAILALQEAQSIAAASAAIETCDVTKELAALPSDFKLHNLEAYGLLRRRARGTMLTAALDAFIDYTKAHAEAGASVFIHQDDMSATAVLNLGTPSAAGQADNKSKLQLKKTAAYSELAAIATGQSLKQATVAEFLEDWPENIKCFNDAGPIETPKAIAAVRKLTIEAMRKIESTEQQLSNTRSAFESVTASSTEPLPTTIHFVCQPFADLQERCFVLRLGVQTGSDKPSITLRITKQEKHAEEMAQELAKLIEAKFDGGVIPVLLGNYTRSE